MKTTEIKIGQEYGVSVHGVIRRARVLNFDTRSRQVPNKGRSWGTHTSTTKMVEVQLADYQGNFSDNSRTDWVLPQAVEVEWAPYVAAQARRSEAVGTARDDCAELRQVAEAAGLNLSVYYTERNGVEAHLGLTDVRKLTVLLRSMVESGAVA